MDDKVDEARINATGTVKGNVAKRVEQLRGKALEGGYQTITQTITDPEVRILCTKCTQFILSYLKLRSEELSYLLEAGIGGPEYEKRFKSLIESLSNRLARFSDTSKIKGNIDVAKLDYCLNNPDCKFLSAEFAKLLSSRNFEKLDERDIILYDLFSNLEELNTFGKLSKQFLREEKSEEYFAKSYEELEEKYKNQIDSIITDEANANALDKILRNNIGSKEQQAKYEIKIKELLTKIQGNVDSLLSASKPAALRPEDRLVSMTEGSGAETSMTERRVLKARSRGDEASSSGLRLSADEISRLRLSRVVPRDDIFGSLGSFPTGAELAPYGGASSSSSRMPDMVEEARSFDLSRKPAGKRERASSFTSTGSGDTTVSQLIEQTKTANPLDLLKISTRIRNKVSSKKQKI